MFFVVCFRRSRHLLRTRGSHFLRSHCAALYAHCAGAGFEKRGVAITRGISQLQSQRAERDFFIRFVHTPSSSLSSLEYAMHTRICYIPVAQAF